jgi:hypothetical protein
MDVTSAYDGKIGSRHSLDRSYLIPQLRVDPLVIVVEESNEPASACVDAEIPRVSSTSTPTGPQSDVGIGVAGGVPMLTVVDDNHLDVKSTQLVARAADCARQFRSTSGGDDHGNVTIRVGLAKHPVSVEAFTTREGSAHRSSEPDISAAPTCANRLFIGPSKQSTAFKSGRT